MPEETHDETVITPVPQLDEDKKEKHAYIVFLSGPLVGKIHLLEEGAIKIGRAADADIPINDLGISRHHLEVKLHQGAVKIKDLGSTNGTFLNGTKVQEADLKDGDKIQISSSTIIKFAYQDKVENIFHTELYRMAVVDALTSAYNKRYFEERLREEFTYCLRNNVPLSLVMMDIDYFKGVNDTHGHQAGDFVLSHIAALAKSIIRNEDILARYGGEEFAIILKATDAKEAMTIAERIRRIIDESVFEFDGKKIHATVSLGIATLSGKNLEGYEAMVKLADQFLYQSKFNGRNRVSG
ncbi:MAG: GGDEF domain-containing protein [Deltaproteobacteria bacterium]|nr:GGDEF domain-containing protein [Deltaproteobacteria bacterium]